MTLNQTYIAFINIRYYSMRIYYCVRHDYGTVISFMKSFIVYKILSCKKLIRLIGHFVFVLVHTLSWTLWSNWSKFQQRLDEPRNLTRFISAPLDWIHSLCSPCETHACVYRNRQRPFCLWASPHVGCSIGLVHVYGLQRLKSPRLKSLHVTPLFTSGT